MFKISLPQCFLNSFIVKNWRFPEFSFGFLRLNINRSINIIISLAITSITFPFATCSLRKMRMYAFHSVWVVSSFCPLETPKMGHIFSELVQETVEQKIWVVVDDSNPHNAQNLGCGRKLHALSSMQMLITFCLAEWLNSFSCANVQLHTIVNGLV